MSNPRTSLPEARLRVLNPRPLDPAGDYALYWMTAQRRTGWNFALERAVEHANAFERPLVVLETLRCDAPWASERSHRFALDGMRDNAERCARAGAAYLACVEREPGEAVRALAELARRAVCVVADDFPLAEPQRELEGAARHLPVRLEAVDANGLLPVRAAERAFSTAASFRRFVQRTLPWELDRTPAPDPLRALRARAGAALVHSGPCAAHGTGPALADLPIDHDVPPVALRGGARAARERLESFLGERLSGYAERRNQPAADATSGLSPYLHFGHVSSHEILAALAEREDWGPERLGERPSGRREGWWGMSAPAEAFLDELVTWREVGFNFSALRGDYDRYESLPEWARKTLERHEKDERPWLYSYGEFERAATHDPLWNAAQRQLACEGRIAGYLRMVWGKKILEWTPSPREALAVMIELNNRFALDGCDPNSYSGIFWVLGRYDRPWTPERPVFGKVRWMSSENTARKFRLGPYLERWGAGRAQEELWTT